MHARVVTFQVQPGKREEAVRLFKEEVVPAAHRQKGFKGGLVLTDPNTGKGMTIGLWEAEADMKATEASGFYQGWTAKFANLFAAPPVREHYEVSIKDI